MSIYFSDLFVEDKVSPKYTACIAFILFKELERSGLIFEMKKDVGKKCHYCEDFDIPPKYTQDTNLPCTEFPDGIKHCLRPVYRYTLFCPPEAFPIKGPLIKKVCLTAVCKDEFDPNEVHGKIIDCIKICIRSLPYSQRSSHYA